jgi:hypothetical protein
MRLSIEAETIFWTDIEIRSATGDTIFEGCLELEPDWWVLKRRTGGTYDTHLKRWAGRRQYEDVLGDALKVIAKLAAAPEVKP